METRRVLLVEDDEAIVEFVSLGLSYEEYEIEVARTGMRRCGRCAAPGRTCWCWT